MRFKPGDVVISTSENETVKMKILSGMRYECLYHSGIPEIVGRVYKDDGHWPDDWRLDELSKIKNILSLYETHNIN